MTQQNRSIEEIMREIETILNENPEPILDLRAKYQFVITDVENGSYLLNIQNGTAVISNEQNADRADCMLKMTAESFQKFLSGNLKGTVALMTGKLKLEGNMSKALQLESLLKQYR